MTWYIKLAILAAYSLVLIVGTWEADNWRWEAKQLAAVQVSEAFHTGEEKIGASADTKFQIEKGKTDAKYQKLNAALDKPRAGAPVACITPAGLRIVNSALTRKAAPASRPDSTLP